MCFASKEKEYPLLLKKKDVIISRREMMIAFVALFFKFKVLMKTELTGYLKQKNKLWLNLI